MKKLILLFILCFITNLSTAITYYLGTSGLVTATSSWWTGTAGTGTHPSNFNTAGNTFVIINQSPTLSGGWTVSGSGSSVTIGMGGIGYTFTQPITSSYHLNGVLNVSAGSVFNNKNTSNPTFGTLDIASTVIFAGYSSQTIPLDTYGNLTISPNAGINILFSAGTTNVAGNYTQSSGYVFLNNSNDVDTLNVKGSFTLSGTSSFYILTSNNYHASGSVNVGGNLNVTTDGTEGMNGPLEENVALVLDCSNSSHGSAILQVSGNATFNSASTYYIDFGNGSNISSQSSHFGIKGNLAVMGRGTFYTHSQRNAYSSGIIFNNLASDSIQTFSYTSTGGISNYTSYTIDTGSYVKMLSPLALGGHNSKYELLTVNGTLDCQSNIISGGLTGNTFGGFYLNGGVNGGTIVTSNTGGIRAAITLLPATFAAGANYVFNASAATNNPFPAIFGVPASVSISTIGILTSNTSFSPTTTLSIGAYSLLDMGSAYILSGAFLPLNSGVIKTSVPTTTSVLAIPSGKTWGGTINYGSSTGLQTIVANTYTNLTLSNSSNTNTSSSNLIVNGVLATTAGGTLDMGVNTLSGTLTSNTGTGSLLTQNTSTLPLPAGKTWATTIKYNKNTGGQTIVGGIYPSLLFTNTSGTNIASGVITVLANFTVPANTIFSDGGNIVAIKGGLNNAGKTIGSGELKLAGTLAQSIQGNGIYTNLEINNTGGVVIVNPAIAHDSITIIGALKLTNGNLASNGGLVIAMQDSTLDCGGNIGQIISGSITGNVIIQQYISGGRRAFRTFGHPFTTSIALSQLENYIDITGKNGATNGFTTTTTNAPSAFKYHTLFGNSSITTGKGDPGWQPFTSCNGTPDSNLWHQYEGVRILVRGTKGEGLYGGTYTKHAVSFRMYGNINTGSFHVPLIKGSAMVAGLFVQDYNQMSNPYPAPLDLGVVFTNAKAAGQTYGNVFWVWNALLGKSGGWDFVDITSTPSYVIPANASFQVRALTNGAYLPFTESNKARTIAHQVLKMPNYGIMLNIYDLNYNLYDYLNIIFNYMATDAEDIDFDGGKAVNPDANLFSLSADHHSLCQDVRPFVAGNSIPLGFTSTTKQQYIIKASQLLLPNGTEVYLHDKYLNEFLVLNQGSEYAFTISADTNSQGNNRFELGMATGDTLKNFNVVLIPNPALSEVTINFTTQSIDKINIKLITVYGKCVYQQDFANTQTGKVGINLSDFPNGIYFVEIISGKNKIIKRLLKQ